MTPAVERTDFGERRFGENPCKIHCDLPRISNAAFTPTGFHLGRTYRIKIADNAADKFRRYGALLAAGNVILKDVFGKRSGNGLVDEFCISKHAVQTAFKVADVGINPFRNKAENFIADVKIFLSYLAAKDCKPCFKIRGLNIGDKSPAEARPQTLFKDGNILGRFIGGYDDLLVRIAKVIEYVENSISVASLPAMN